MEGQGLSAAFADRLAALVVERRSQVCLGIDPDPAAIPARPRPGAGVSPAEAAADAIVAHSRELIAAAAPACVAAKPQLACFERLGWHGWRALEAVVAAAREAGLLVIADGKRGDVPVSAAAYAQALFSSTETPWGPVAGLGVDAATLNPLLGGDALEPLIEAAADAGAGIFVLVRTSNPGAAEVLDLDCGGAPLFERLAGLIAARADRLAGSGELTGVGAVVGATEPSHLARLRELMPRSVFLIPGVGAQGGSARELGPAFSDDPASALIAASRSIAGAADPGAAAEALRDEVWAVSQTAAR
ncbi:MAG: orotidine-5'-phosphate decarboxylase [Solirubrobacterales bacterium]|nr:orotidine-5'-phosphate decarboxylase [Solirubrobacterales bacterium]